jgi:hypothetical protein
MGEPHFTNGRPLYRLSNITKRCEDFIWVFEGEICIDSAEKLNLMATTSGSATSASTADWTALAGRKIILWPDNDPEGVKYIKDVTDILFKLNCNVYHVDIGKLNLPSKGDIVDWLLANPTADIKQIPLIEIQRLETSNIIFIKACDIKPLPIDWLWDQHFARGKCSMIVGDPGLGKSQLTAFIAAILTQGGIWPDKTSYNQTGGIAILSAEDDPACTIVPRLIAAGADLNKVRIIEAVKKLDSDGQQRLKQFDLVADIHELDKMLTEAGNILAVIIDPISAYLDNINSHNNSDVRFALAPLFKLADKHNVAIICVSHLNKMSNGNAISRVSGSVAFTAASRAAFLVAKDKTDDNKRLFLQLKNNLGNCKHGFAFEIEPYTLNNDILTSRIKWLDEIVNISADEAINSSFSSSAFDNNSSLKEAKEFLQNLLLHQKVPQQDIKKKAEESGYSWRTIERAKKELNVKSKKVKTTWYWYLLSEESQDSQTAAI